MSIDNLPTLDRSSPTFVAEVDDFFAAKLNAFIDQTNAVAAAMTLSATNGSSATSVAIGTGSKTFTADAGKSWQLGMTLKIASTASPTNSMLGDVTAYNGSTGALTINVPSTSAISGSGTFSAWTISQSGVAAQAGQGNKIINADFALNQDAKSGTVVLAAGVYGHDGFKAGAGGCTYTFSKSNNITTLTISAGTLLQVIDGSYLFSGAHVLSWTGTATARIDSGSYGGSGITGTAVGGTNQTVEWATGTLSKPQYEEGTRPTLWNLMPNNLIECYRQYEKGGFFHIGYNAGTLSIGTSVQFRVKKRASPTLTQTNISTNNCGAGTNSVLLNDPTGGFLSFRLVTTTGAAQFEESWTASARL